MVEEFCSIVGPSGCGKSTLLSALAGRAAQRRRVDARRQAVRGRQRKVEKLHAAARQSFQWRTIRDNVTLGLAIRHELTPGSWRVAARALRARGVRCEAPGAALRRYARALIGRSRARPKVLLLDEPFSALDYQTRLAVSSGYLPHHPPRGQDRPCS